MNQLLRLLGRAVPPRTTLERPARLEGSCGGNRGVGARDLPLVDSVMGCLFLKADVASGVSMLPLGLSGAAKYRFFFFSSSTSGNFPELSSAP